MWPLGRERLSRKIVFIINLFCISFLVHFILISLLFFVSDGYDFNYNFVVSDRLKDVQILFVPFVDHGKKVIIIEHPIVKKIFKKKKVV